MPGSDKKQMDKQTFESLDPGLQSEIEALGLAPGQDGYPSGAQACQTWLDKFEKEAAPLLEKQPDEIQSEWQALIAKQLRIARKQVLLGKEDDFKHSMVLLNANLGQLQWNLNKKSEKDGQARRKKGAKISAEQRAKRKEALRQKVKKLYALKGRRTDLVKSALEEEGITISRRYINILVSN